MTTTSTLQIFIYNANEYQINRDNNYPLLVFDTCEERNNFIRGLRSVNRDASRTIENDNEPYFVINNPQLIPINIRNLHMYPYESPFIADYMRNRNQNPLMMDGIFRLSDNLEYILSYVTIKNNVYGCKLNDNTLEPNGFTNLITLYAQGNQQGNQGSPSPSFIDGYI